MTFNNLTQADAIRIRDVIAQLEASEAAQLETDRQTKIAVANAWWDGIKPAAPTTRTEALAVFRFIETEIRTHKTNFENETDPVQKEAFRFRVALLHKKLRQANEKFKEVKAANR